MNHNIGQWVAKRALLNPKTEAIVDITSGRRQTYVELDARCNQVSNGLVSGGLARRPGRHLVDERSGVRRDLLRRRKGRRRDRRTQLAPRRRRIVVHPHRLRRLHARIRHRAQRGGGRAQSRGTDGTKVGLLIHVDDAADRPDFAEGYEDMISASSSAPIVSTAGDDDLLFIMYTSGTTGSPKGAMHSHNTSMWGCLTANVTADTRYGDNYLICLPLFHVGALNPMLSIINLGGTATIMSEFDPVKIWEVFGEEKITVTLAVPAMLQFMLLTYDKDAHDTSSLRWVMSGAAPVPVSLIETYAAMGIEIHQVYGLTETCGPACLISPDDALDRAGSTGKEFFFTRAWSTKPATTADRTSPAKCWSRDPTSWSATSTARTPLPSRSSTDGCARATSP